MNGHRRKWPSNIKLDGPGTCPIRVVILSTDQPLSADQFPGLSGPSFLNPSIFPRPVILDHVVENYFSIKTFLLNFKSEIILSANIIIIFLRIK